MTGAGKYIQAALMNAGHAVKPAFHDADTEILARMSVSRNAEFRRMPRLDSYTLDGQLASRVVHICTLCKLNLQTETRHVAPSVEFKRIDELLILLATHAHIRRVLSWVT